MGNLPFPIVSIFYLCFVYLLFWFHFPRDFSEFWKHQSYSFYLFWGLEEDAHTVMILERTKRQLLLMREKQGKIMDYMWVVTRYTKM